MSSESIKADNDTLSNKFRGHDKTEAATMMTPKEAKQKMGDFPVGELDPQLISILNPRSQTPSPN